MLTDNEKRALFNKRDRLDAATARIVDDFVGLSELFMGWAGVMEMSRIEMQRLKASMGWIRDEEKRRIC